MAGGGPAGCAAAIGLRRLGFDVTLVHVPRPFAGCEGISARTLEGLRRAGLHRAAATVPGVSPRRALWGGASADAATEHLLQREAFDPALLEDAAGAGVALIEGRLRNVAAAGTGHKLSIDVPGGDNRLLRCRFLVEARGRTAPGSAPQAGLRGPPGVSLMQRREGGEGPAYSLVAAFDEGWLWYARPGDGSACVQLTLSAGEGGVPGRGALEVWFGRRLARPDIAGICPVGGEALPGITARGSASVLQGELVTSDSIRVGDAAMAVDPLSGNGIFQALSSALAAPAVVNTLLTRPENAPAARRFYCARVRQLFLQFARTGRDFYRIEGERRSDVFWRERSEWPDDEPAHDSDPTFIGIETRPVLADGFIHDAPVAITSDQPLGVWHVAGVTLAELLADLPADPRDRAATLDARLQHQGDPGHPRRRALAAWLARYRLLPATVD